MFALFALQVLKWRENAEFPLVCPLGPFSPLPRAGQARAFATCRPSHDMFFFRGLARSGRDMFFFRGAGLARAATCFSFRGAGRARAAT